MKRPKMVLFDYGETLVDESPLDFLKAEYEVFKHVTDNPKNVTPEEVCEFASKLFADREKIRQAGHEVRSEQIYRVKYEYLGIRLDIPISEVERITFIHSSDRKPMPYVNEMLDELKRLGIRTGVISNLGWPGAVLSEQLDKLLPSHLFEFIMASSDYGFRKPDPIIFETALNRAGIEAKDAWYCGDRVEADIVGANKTGIFPVLYDRHDKDPEVPYEHLRVTCWREFVNIIKELPE